MTDDERAAYLAAAERLEHLAGKEPWPEYLLRAEAVLSIALMLPEGHPAREMLLWLRRDQRSDDPVFSAWLLEAAALKLRAMVEEACLG